MAIYKFHKRKYRWISNAFGSIYVNIAILLTVSTMSILEEVKEWAYTRVEGYKQFLKANTSLYQIIDSINDLIINVPPMIHNIYVTNITRCFESIPIIGRDTLFEAMEFITSLGVSNMKRKFPNSEQFLWVKTNFYIYTHMHMPSSCTYYSFLVAHSSQSSIHGVHFSHPSYY